MRWTYDPLQLGNAHLNLRSLAAVGTRYHPDFYGPMGGINGGLPVIVWSSNGSCRPAPCGRRSVDVVVPPGDSRRDRLCESRLHCTPGSHLRDAMLPLFEDGWIATDVDRDASTYTLTR
jgi:chorismate synthase